VDRFLKFFTEMDARAARTLWVSTLLFGAAGLILTFGIFFLDVDQGVVAEILRTLRDAWWAPAAVTGIFTILAFFGAPQIALIAGTVAVFGPAEGIILSWLATMISASVGYLIGRVGGEKALARFGGDFAQRIAATVKDNGFLAALIIRLVPSGPFIMVNMARGATGRRSSWFLGGTGVGIVPKIVLVAFAGHGLNELFEGQNLGAVVFLAAAAIVWLIIVFVVRPLLRRNRGEAT
jgi:uncharacterized membrane protein YdjX (TVP38/TMEM64 family)